MNHKIEPTKRHTTPIDFIIFITASILAAVLLVQLGQGAVEHFNTSEMATGIFVGLVMYWQTRHFASQLLK